MTKKVVIIERDRDILEVVSYILVDAGYAVSAIGPEDVTLEYIISEKPNLILLDVINISKEGTALCKAIKDNPELGKIPVVALSTHLKPQLIKETCADDVMKKPFDIDELLQIVEEHI
ncbi:response regulator receiver domain-containing protein [Arcticibacter pallidicorallinus]|uniref:Response regulator receiver domain-containing protein n=1 Tax=Arcticibacter pallidicorallinus TaxID=1259464 RepID=A0A2T0UB91_9SPHI|nr:response regulator [Arcticibacter pallidicorallinus]PRY55205.1 response regulator receiver domain-containing protein [Arcticibacter pallidicorallinus]